MIGPLLIPGFNRLSCSWTWFCKVPVGMTSKQTLAILLSGLAGMMLGAKGVAQSPSAPASQETSSGAATSGSGAEPRSWIVRDPVTGRLYQQELVTRSVPTTVWEVRPVTTTVYEPQQVVSNVPSQQVTYTPTTQYVMQPRLRGWWNPLRQPVQSYEFVPVTSWQPQTQTVQNPQTTTQWVPKQQVVYAPQPVQRLQTQQHIVSRELPQPPAGHIPSAIPSGYATAPMLAAQPRPLVTIPILAQQRMLPWPSGAPVNAMRSVVGNGLRPINNAARPNYAAPLQTASSASTHTARDPMQSGMAATILR